jgi:hypothetical protein
MRSALRFVPLSSVFLAACGGSPNGPSEQDEAALLSPSASEADLEHVDVKNPPFNGVWGVLYGENILASNNLGSHTKGACSGPTSGAGCGGAATSLRSLAMPALSVSAPSGDAAATASASGKASLGLLSMSAAVSADYSDPYTSGSDSAANLAWYDTIIPPAADTKHPAGTPINFDVSLTLTDKGETLDCSEYSIATYQAEVDVAAGLSIVRGCSSTGASPDRTKIATSYGALPVSISGTLSVNLQASGDTASWSASLPAIEARVRVTSPSKVAYTTGSGKCYGKDGACL